MEWPRLLRAELPDARFCRARVARLRAARGMAGVRAAYPQSEFARGVPTPAFPTAFCVKVSSSWFRRLRPNLQWICLLRNFFDLCIAQFADEAGSTIAAILNNQITMQSTGKFP